MEGSYVVILKGLKNNLLNLLQLLLFFNMGEEANNFLAFDYGGDKMSALRDLAQRPHQTLCCCETKYK